MRMLALLSWVWSKVPYWLRIVLAAVALFAVVRIARADTTAIQLRQLNVLVRDGAVPDSPAYSYMMSGWDGTNAQFFSTNTSGQLLVMPGSGSFGVSATDDAAFVQGTDPVTPAGFIYDDTLTNDPEENDVALARIDSKRAVVGRIEGETRGVSADVLTLGADDTVNTTNGLTTYSMLMGYESVGGVWDRLRMDTSGNLFVSLATALDSSIDSVSIAVNDVIPQMDSTDRMAVSIYGTNAAAGDTQPTVTTTQANNLAATLDTLNVSSFLYGYDGTTFDLLTTLAAAGDDQAAQNGSLTTWSTLLAFDGTNYDRLRTQNTSADNLAFSSPLNVFSIMGAYDGANFDRVVGFPGNADDQTGPSTNGLLGTMSAVFGYDEDDTNWDRVYGYDTDGDNVATEAEGVTLATTGFNRLLDEAGTYDRERVSQVTGFYTPAAATTTLAVDTSDPNCVTDSSLAAGYYVLQTDAVIWCELGADDAAITATTGDWRIENPGIYTITTTSTQDTICCVTAAGTATLNINAVTWN